MATQTNEWYLQHLKNGSSEGLNTIRQDCYPPISHFIRTHGGTEQDAEDIFADGVIVIYRKLKAGEVVLTCKFSVFLFQICKNLWYKQVRRRKFSSKLPVEETESQYVTDDWTPVLEKTERMSLLQACFLKLTDSCQEVLRLAWDPEKDLKQVAEQLKTTYDYIRKRKSTCSQKLKELIKADPRYEELR